MRIYATYSIKGGVGKTTAAVNLAHLAAAGGARTVLWDLDPQGAASFMFRVKPRVKGGGRALIGGKRSLDDAIKGTDYGNLDLIPADITYRNMDLLLGMGGPGGSGRSGSKAARRLGELLAPLAGEYDAVFLDCPPGMSLVCENVLHAADVVVVPLIPTTLSLRTLAQLTGFVAEFSGRRPRVLAFYSMADRRKKLHRQTIAARLPERAPVAATVIPYLSMIENMSVGRCPVTACAPRSAAARAYRALWSEVRAVPEPGTPPAPEPPAPAPEPAPARPACPFAHSGPL
jgi:cellulose biosynthesis protein BcsQ